MTRHTEDRRITVIVDKEVHQTLKLEAVKHETTVSDIVRGLIEGWLDGVKADPAPAESLSGSR